MNPKENSFKNVMTIKELSQYLKISVSSLYFLTSSGKIPAVKVGKHWRYMQSEILNLWPQKITNPILMIETCNVESSRPALYATIR